MRSNVVEVRLRGATTTHTNLSEKHDCLTVSRLFRIITVGSINIFISISILGSNKGELSCIFALINDDKRNLIYVSTTVSMNWLGVVPI